MSIEVSYGIIPFKRHLQAIYVLLIQHRAGHWSFPKGGPHQNEHPIDTAQRELKEETGLKVKRLIIPEKSFSENYVYIKGSQKIQKRVEYFLAEVEGDVNIFVEELRDSIWLSPDQIEAHATFPESKQVCCEVKAFLEEI